MSKVSLHIMDDREVIATVEVTSTLTAAWRRALRLMDAAVENYPCGNQDIWNTDWKWARREIKKAVKITPTKDFITSFNPYMFSIVWHESFRE